MPLTFTQAELLACADGAAILELLNGNTGTTSGEGNSKCDNCPDCTNCFNCKTCSSCVNCKNCEDCVSCIDCEYVKNGSNCSRIIPNDATNKSNKMYLCSDCIACDRCIGIVGGVDLRNCVGQGIRGEYLHLSAANFTSVWTKLFPEGIR